MLGDQSGLGVGKVLKAKWDASQIPQTSSKSSPMTEQQPIHILSRSVSPVSPETDLWAKQHPASPVPSSVSDWSALHPLVEFCFPEELQHCVNHWHDGSNP